jgi:flagellar L-ring protein precursor FlgH
MRRIVCVVALCGGFAGAARADSIWDRRTFGSAYIFVDTRARRVGDLVTIAIAENTDIENKDERDGAKNTKTGGTFTFGGNIAGTGSTASRSASLSMNALHTSQREFTGTSQYNVAQNFTDRVTATVVGVMPNGNLVVEGSRTRVVGKEVRTLCVSGVIRPIDISPTNTIQSQYVGDFKIIYLGRGDQSAYTNHGWLGKKFNQFWPW